MNLSGRLLPNSGIGFPSVAEDNMTPFEITQQQIQRYRQMSGQERLSVALDLHELSCEIARDGIRARFPDASVELIEAKLRERLRQSYRSASNAGGND